MRSATFPLAHDILSSVICHFSLGLHCAIRGFNRFAHDLTAVGYDAGLKDFVVEIQTEGLAFLVPKMLHKSAEVI